MSQAPLYVGFDLGTTNSAAAVFDGEKATIVRNSHGAPLTPSVVRVDGRGRVTVGSRAQRYLERDPANTHGEFKRLMGTNAKLEFPAAGETRGPADLASEILRSLRADVEDQFGVAPRCAVISVPALFELPQSSATSQAATIAGFERVELLQEPIASALAAGWSAADDDAGNWLVYDLGGGTFDASLLETSDGFLRVVGHDGDNFLGGRDFDWAIVDWAIEQIERETGVSLSRANPEHSGPIASIKHGAEEVKIELSRSDEAELSLVDLDVGGRSIDIDLELDRVTLQQLCVGIVDRSISVCRRLLRSHDVEGRQLARIVLVGGPTIMPFLRARIGDGLGAPIAEGHDPMTLVAQGAAIYAATAGLDARPERAVQRTGRRLWLQYPAVSSDLEPHVVGRLVEGAGPTPYRLTLVRGDGEWQSTPTVIDPEGGFVVQVALQPRQPNEFELRAVDDDGVAVDVEPRTINIVQGLTISDPPLSRTIGVALANDRVRPYFERGTPLPARRTFTHYTVESVAKGSRDCALKIPLVQGEFEAAHLCRLVGLLEIGGTDIDASLAAGSTIEVTLELDRGGQLSARALVPALDQVFEGVAHLLVPDAEPAALEASVDQIKKRIEELRAQVFRSGATTMLGTLASIENDLEDAHRNLIAARGGDQDAGQQTRRSLLDIDARLEAMESARRWPELEEKTVSTMTWATSWVSEFGTPREQRLFEEIGSSIDRAREERDLRELQRQLRLAQQLGETAYFRDPGAWETMFESAASRLSEATDLPRAHTLVEQGRQCTHRDDTQGLRRVVEKLWKLLPADARSRKLGFDSGVR